MKIDSNLVAEMASKLPGIGMKHDQTIDVPNTPLVEFRVMLNGPEKLFNGFYDLEDSFAKEFHYLGDICKEPISLEFGGKEFKFLPPKKVIVSDNLFREYSCLDYGCSRCCKKTRYWNIFSENEYNLNKEKYPTEVFNGNFTEAKVNGVAKKFYVEDRTMTFCNHLDMVGEMCRIHEANPIHCMFPMTKFKRMKNTQVTYITKEIFGRNWNMQCPAAFKPMTEGGFKSTEYMFLRLKALADEMNVDTHIDYIIEDFQKRYYAKHYSHDLSAFFKE